MLEHQLAHGWSMVQGAPKASLVVLRREKRDAGSKVGTRLGRAPPATRWSGLALGQAAGAPLRARDENGRFFPWFGVGGEGTLQGRRVMNRQYGSMVQEGSMPAFAPTAEGSTGGRSASLESGALQVHTSCEHQLFVTFGNVGLESQVKKYGPLVAFPPIKST